MSLDSDGGRRVNDTQDDSFNWSEQIIAQTERHWSVSGNSVIAAWVMSLVGAISIILLFSSRRRKKPLHYLPRYLLLISRELESQVLRAKGDWRAAVPSSDPNKKDLETVQWDTREIQGVKRQVIKQEELEAPFLGWLRCTWHDLKVELNLMNRKGVKKRDERLLRTLGMDAFTILEFLRMLRWLFALVTVFVAAPLLAANYFINTQTSYGSQTDVAANATDSMDGNNMTSVIGDLQLYTAANITGNGLWVHVSAEIAVTLIVILQVVVYSHRHERAIETWAEMNANEVAFKTLLLTGLSLKSTDTRKAEGEICRMLGVVGDEDINISFKQDKMGETYDRVEYWNNEGHKRAAAAVERIIQQSKADIQRAAGDTTGANGGKVMVGKSGGFCGLFAESIFKSDMDIVLEQISLLRSTRLHQNRLKEQETTGRFVKDVTAAFATWPTASQAHTVLHRLVRQGNLDFKVERAPRDICVLWKNLEKNEKTIKFNKMIGKILTGLLIGLNSAPLLVITMLANLDALIESTPRLKQLREDSAFMDGVLTALGGVVPATLAAIFVLALPYVMRFLSRWQGALSRGRMDQDVIRQMFIFLLLSKFVLFSLLGIAYETYMSIKDQLGQDSPAEIFASLGDVPAKITRTYINQSSYWLSYYPIRTVVTWLNLLQLPRWLIMLYKHHIEGGARTRDRLEETAQPWEVEPLSTQISLVYTPLAPLIAMCAAIYFWVSSIVVQNTLTFVEATVETDGKAWRVVLRRLISGLFLMQGLMCLTVLFKTKPFDTSSETPLSTRLAPLIVAILPLGGSVWIMRHVRTYRSAAEIIIGRKASDKDEGVPEKAPRFEHEILKTSALKQVKVFDADVDVIWEQVLLYQQKMGRIIWQRRGWDDEWSGMMDLLPQLEPHLKQLRDEEARKEREIREAEAKESKDGRRRRRKHGRRRRGG